MSIVSFIEPFIISSLQTYDVLLFIITLDSKNLFSFFVLHWYISYGEVRLLLLQQNKMTVFFLLVSLLYFFIK